MSLPPRAPTETATSPAADRPPPARVGEGLGRKALGATVLGILVFAGLLFYGDVQRLRANLTAFRWSAFALGLGLATANYGLRFARWEYYLRRIGVVVPVVESARVFVAGFVMSISPGKVGEVLKSLLLHEARGVSIARTAPIVVAERLTDLLALVVLAAVGSLALDQGPTIAVAGGLTALGLWTVCAFRPVGELALRVCERLPILGRLSPRLREAYESLHTLVGPGPLSAATALATVSWFLECVTLQVIAEGFGVHLGFMQSAFAYSVPTIVGALAMMPGGLGVTEASMAGVLESMGGAEMTTSVATATTMLVRIATLWWAVVLGFGALALHRRALVARVR